MTIDEMEGFLVQASYDIHDIMDLSGRSKSKSYEIMRRCRRLYDGSIPGRPECIKASSYWFYEGTTIESQLRLIRQAKES